MDDVKEFIKQLTNEQIIHIMIELGSEQATYGQQKENQIIFTSICHSDTTKHKLYAYKNEEGHNFYCFVCLFQGSIIDLVMHVREWEFKEAMAFLRKTLGIRGSFTPTIKTFGTIPLIEDWDLFNKYKTYSTPNPTIEVYNQNILRLFDKDGHISWYQDNISLESMRKFEIGFYAPHNAIIIPHRDINGNLIGIRKRNLGEREVASGFKYIPLKIEKIEYNHSLQFNLYGLYENQHTIRKLKKVAIFESEKAVLQCQTYFGDMNFSLACCGSSVSNTQRDLILDLGVEEVIVCVDRDWKDRTDEKYRIFCKKIDNIVRKFTPYVNVCVVNERMEEFLDLKDSPSDKGKEVLIKLMKSKEFVTTTEKER